MATLSTPLARLQALLLANLSLQALDGWMTLMGTERGFPEGNPLVASAMAWVGPLAGILAVKTIAVVFLVLVYRLGRNRLVEPGLASLAVVYAVFAVVPWTLILAGSSSLATAGPP